MLTNRERLILLNLIPEIGSTRLRRLLDAFGTLDRMWTASVQELQQAAGVGPSLAQRIADGRRDEAALRRELALVQRHGATLVTLEDAEYPARLRTIADPPVALYVHGTLEPADATAVAIVGSRLASPYGLQSAERLAYDLALRGVTVVSGLARGIDGAAHRGALRASGRTLAVLGGGLARLYPEEHARLASEVAARGALISEYPMDTPPLSYYFPRRNRIISGLSLGVVIVEAAQRSGALITADCALEQGREVFAVPGPMTAATSQGTHHLLKQGARLVTSVDDIVEELRLTASPDPAAVPARAATASAHLSERQEAVLASLHDEQPRYIDTVAAQRGLAVADVSSLLLELELKRLVQQLPGKQFVRTTL